MGDPGPGDVPLQPARHGVPNDLVVAAPGSTVGGTFIPPATLIVPRRNNGPIVSLNPATGAALSVQYTGFSGTRELETFLIWDTARNLDEFLNGLQYFDSGSQNIVYVDVRGNIAYFTSSELPIREDLQAGPSPARRRGSSATARAATSGCRCSTRSPGRRSRTRSCRSPRCRTSSTRLRAGW